MPQFESRFVVDAGIDEVAEFHFRPGILKTLTPPLMVMQVHQFEPLADGSVAEFTMWMGPIPVYWKAVHSDVGPTGFTDTQTEGPMKTWVHRHEFVAVNDQQTEVRDTISYEHHGGIKGLWSRILFPKPALRMLFAIRARITRRNVESK